MGRKTVPLDVRLLPDYGEPCVDAYVGYGDMDRLGVEAGGALEIEGAGRTVARCVPAPPYFGEGGIAIGGLKAECLGAGPRGTVDVRGIDAPEAGSVTLAPLGPVPPADEGFLAERLRGAPLAVGDRVRPLYHGWLGPEFQVTGAEPSAGAVTVARGTDVRVAEDGEGSRAVPPAPMGAAAGRLAGDAERLGAAMGPALEGRGGGGWPPGGILTVLRGASRTDRLLLSRAAAAARGAHFVRMPAGLLRSPLHGSVPCAAGDGATVPLSPGAGHVIAAARKSAPSAVFVDFGSYPSEHLLGRDRLGVPEPPAEVDHELVRGLALLAIGLGAADRVAVIASVPGEEWLPHDVRKAEGQFGDVEIRGSGYGTGGALPDCCQAAPPARAPRPRPGMRQE